MLKSLLDPVLTPEAFFNEYWQTKPAIIERGNVHALSSVFTLADLEELFCNCIRLGDLKGESPMLVFPVPGQQHNEVRNPFFAYSNHCSVVINKADRYSLAAHRLCSALQETFPFVFCSVCVTPPRTQSVSKHSQDREILLLQVYGEKEWTIYNNPIPLPYRDEQVGKGFPIDGESLQMLARKVVRQGDVVYIPRGFVHEGRTGPIHGSVYISIALQTSDWDYNTVLLGIIQKVLRSHDVADIGRPCVPLPLLTRACLSSSHQMDAPSRNTKSGATSTTGSVSGSRSIGFQRQVPSSQASVASSHGMPVHHHHVHPHHLNPSVPSWKPTVISNEIVEKTNRVFANLRDALMETQEMMNSDAALQLFGGRLSALRDERDMFVRMGSAQALDLPLQPDSLICWNYTVVVGHVTQIMDPSIPTLNHTIHFFRRPSGHHGMQFATYKREEHGKNGHARSNQHPNGEKRTPNPEPGAEPTEDTPEGIRRIPAMHFDPNSQADFSEIQIGSPSHAEGLGQNGSDGTSEPVAQTALPNFQPKANKASSDRSISLVSNDTPPQLEITRELEEFDGRLMKDPAAGDEHDRRSNSTPEEASSPKYHLENTDRQEYSNEFMAALAKEVSMYNPRDADGNLYYRGGNGMESESDANSPHAQGDNNNNNQQANGNHHGMHEMDPHYIVSLACSEETMRTVMFLYSHHARVPCSVGSIPLQDVLSRYTLANLLLHNGCCTRIS